MSKSLNTPKGRALCQSLEEQKDYRRYVATNFQDTSVHQFIVATQMGLHEDNKMLDVGCGPLTGGRYFMMFLRAGNYYGIEPSRWLLNTVIEKEIGEDFIIKRQAHFANNDDFDCKVFGDDTKFDFILAHSIYSHAPLWMIEKSLANIASVMHRDSRFVGTYFKGNPRQEYKYDEWVYPQGVFFTVNTMYVAFHNAGLKFTSVPIIHPENQTWFVATK